MSNTPCPDSTAVTPDTGDIQKLVTRGYTFNCSRHLILTVQDPAHARKFLKGLANNGWLIGAQENRGKVDQYVVGHQLHAQFHCFSVDGVVAVKHPTQVLYAAHLQDRALHLLAGDNTLHEQAHSESAVGGAFGEVDLAVPEIHVRGRIGLEFQAAGQIPPARGFDQLPRGACVGRGAGVEQVNLHHRCFGTA
jgi:hypothetical protein